MLLHIFKKYRIDEVITLTILLIVAAAVGERVEPFCRSFQFSDSSISYPYYEHEKFPVASLAPLIVVPVFLFALCIFFPQPDQNGWHEFAHWVLVHAEAIIVQFITIQFLKVSFGRLRPDFLGRVSSFGYNSTSVVVDYCKVADPKHVLREGRLSFPSGHAGTAFASLLPMCFFFMSRLRPFYYASLWRFVVCFLPLILSSVISVSRTQDYRHNYVDVLAGSLLGIAPAMIALRLNFTSDASGIMKVRYNSPVEEATQVAQAEDRPADEGCHSPVIVPVDSK